MSYGSIWDRLCALFFGVYSGSQVNLCCKFMLCLLNDIVNALNIRERSTTALRYLINDGLRHAHLCALQQQWIGRWTKWKVVWRGAAYKIFRKMYVCTSVRPRICIFTFAKLLFFFVSFTFKKMRKKKKAGHNRDLLRSTMVELHWKLQSELYLIRSAVRSHHYII